MKTFSHLWRYFAKFFLEWEMFQIKVVEKIKTYILCSVTFFFSENRAVYEIMWRKDSSQTGHKWRHNMAHTRWKLDKQGYTHAGVCTCPRAWAPTGTHAHAHTDTFIIRIAFPLQKWFANAYQCYVTRTLPVFFNVWYSVHFYCM